MPVTINGSNTPTAGGVVYGDGSAYASTTAGSAGSVLYSAGASAPAFTAVGTAGQVLQSNGAAAPSWVAAAGGSAATPSALGTVYGTTTAASANNTGLGYSALPSISSGISNVAIGFSAGNATNSGASNVFVGPYSGYVNLNGNGLVAIGNNALVSNTSGSYNVAVGQQALNANISSSNNVAIGYQSGFAVTGAKNTIIGGYTGSAAPISTTGSNFVVLSDGDGNIVASSKTAQTFALAGGTLSSGTGIAFPATQSASSDANTLDDYEEGTYTLSLGGTSTTSINAGIYTKVGRMVHCMGLISVTTLGTGSATTITGGLPFNPSNAGGGNSGGSVSYYSGLAVNVIAISPYLVNSSTNLAFSGSAAASAGSSGLAIFGNGARIDYTAVYST
jgi:hypothetical protein